MPKYLTLRSLCTGIIIAASLLLPTLAGCGGGDKGGKPGDQGGKPGDKQDDHKDHKDKHTHTETGTGGNTATVAVTPEQLAQYPLTTCVVTDEKLGEQGKIIDHVHEGRLVRFCCKECIGDFNKDPKKYLAKLDAAAAARGAAAKP